MDCALLYTDKINYAIYFEISVSNVRHVVYVNMTKVLKVLNPVQASKLWVLTL